MDWRNKGERDQNGRPLELGQQQRIQSSKLNQIGTDSSVSLAYVQGVEHHRPNIRMPSGHRSRLRRRIRYLLSYIFIKLYLFWCVYIKSPMNLTHSEECMSLCSREPFTDTWYCC